MRAVLSAAGGIVRRCGLWAAAFLLAAVLAGLRLRRECPGICPGTGPAAGDGSGGAGAGGGAAAQTAEPYQVLNDNVPYFTEEELAGGVGSPLRPTVPWTFWGGAGRPSPAWGGI